MFKVYSLGINDFLLFICFIKLSKDCLKEINGFLNLINSVMLLRVNSKNIPFTPFTSHETSMCKFLCTKLKPLSVFVTLSKFKSPKFLIKGSNKCTE